MGAERHNEGPHAGQRDGPKLTITGRLDGTVAGQPVQILANGSVIQVVLTSYRSLWLARRGLLAAAPAGVRASRLGRLTVQLVIGERAPVAVLPKPHPVFALFLPRPEKPV